MPEIVDVKRYAPSHVMPAEEVLTRDSIDMDPHGILMTVPGDKDHPDIINEFFRRIDEVNYFDTDFDHSKLLCPSQIAVWCQLTWSSSKGPIQAESAQV